MGGSVTAPKMTKRLFSAKIDSIFVFWAFTLVRHGSVAAAAVVSAASSPSSSTIGTTATTEDGNAQKFLREPVDQTARQGTHVTLPCRVANKRGTLQWTRNGFGLGVERNLTGFDRYHMTGSDEEGDFTLDIDPVTLDDDANFQCQVGAARGVDPIRSSFAYLTVTVPPQEPEIINGRELRTTEDRTVIIKCVSKGGKPPAEITWVDGSGTVVTDDVSYETEPVENTKRVTAKSKLKFQAKKSHHNTTLTCEAQNSADPVPKKATIRIFVEYAPEVTVTKNRKRVREHDDVTFSCSAHANPSAVTFRWFVDNELIPGNHGRELTLKKVDRSQNGKIVKCEVTNGIGKSEETETLDINYSPRFVVKPADVSGERDQEAVLMCQVDGNPSPTYTWFKNGDMQTVIGYEQNLTVTIGPASSGKYLCRASVPGFSEVIESADVLMKGPPRVIRRDPVQFGTEGDTVQLTCEAFSIPPPVTLHWSLYGFPVNTASSHFTLMETSKKDGMKSTLVIRDSISSDFGDYNCTVRNQFGSDSFVITLQKKKSLPLIIILSAVIGGIILTVATILIMIVCRRGGSFKSKMSDGKIRSSRSTTTSGSKLTSSSNGGGGIGGIAASTTESEALNPNKSFDEIDNWDVGTCLNERYHLHHRSMGYDDYQSRLELGYIGGGDYGQYPGNFLGGGSYAPHQQPLPPPPPPPPPHLSGGELNNFRGGGLNVTDPRLSAKYGNPYLRNNVPTSSTSVQQLHDSPSLASPHRYIHPKGYSTLNPRHHHHHNANVAAIAPAAGTGSATGTLKSSKKNSASYGTNGSLTGPASSASGKGRVMAVDGGSNQYILSPESEVKPGALATHV